MRRIIKRIAGNKRALARLVVILVLVLTAVILAHPLRADPVLLVGSCVGAALSLTVGSLVAILESDQLETVPPGFLDAAKWDIHQTTYYRENQTIRVSVTRENSKGVIIELRFSADIIPANEIAKIEHPKVDPPPGATLDFISYKIDKFTLAKDQDREIRARTKDQLVVRYLLDNPLPDYIEDAHLWPSPVLDYVVEFDTSGGHSFQVGKIVAGSRSIALRERTARRSRIQEFVGDGPAFRTQGLRWKVTRGSSA